MRSLFRSILLPAFGVFVLCLGGFTQAKTIEGVVNINTASVFELSLLPGIGKAKADQIVQIRQAKPFASVEDLKAIKGLGGKRLELIRPHLVLSGPTTAKAVKESKLRPPAPAMSGSSNPPASPKL